MHWKPATLRYSCTGKQRIELMLLYSLLTFPRPLYNPKKSLLCRVECVAQQTFQHGGLLAQHIAIQAYTQHYPPPLPLPPIQGPYSWQQVRLYPPPTLNREGAGGVMRRVANTRLAAKRRVAYPADMNTIQEAVFLTRVDYPVVMNKAPEVRHSVQQGQKLVSKRRISKGKFVCRLQTWVHVLLTHPFAPPNNKQHIIIYYISPQVVKTDYRSWRFRSYRFLSLYTQGSIDRGGGWVGWGAKASSDPLLLKKGRQCRWEDHEITGENITLGVIISIYCFWFVHIVGHLLYHMLTARIPFSPMNNFQNTFFQVTKSHLGLKQCKSCQLYFLDMATLTILPDCIVTRP